MHASPTVIVIDGHDGAGKTTLALALAQLLGGTYVKPFNGSLGDLIAWLFEHQDFALTDQVARAAIAKITQAHPHTPYLIFDRHWLSMFSVLPPRYYPHWIIPAHSFLCWADLATTCARLAARGEDLDDLAEHAHFCAKYKALAHQFNVPIIDTAALRVEAALGMIQAALAAPCDNRP